MSDRAWGTAVSISIGLLLSIITWMIVEEVHLAQVAQDPEYGFGQQMEWEFTSALLLFGFWTLYSALVYLISWVWTRLRG